MPMRNSLTPSTMGSPIGKAVVLIQRKWPTAAVVAIFTTWVLGGVPEGDSDDAGSRSYRTSSGFLERGLNDLAVDEFQSFLSSYPGHNKTNLARYGLGVAYYRLNRCGDAVNALNTLVGVADFEFGAEVLLVIGQCQLAARNYSDSFSAFDAIIARFPDHPQLDSALAGAAEARFAEGRCSDSIGFARTLAQKFPDRPAVLRSEYVRAVCEMDAGEHIAAAERFATIAAKSREEALVDRATFLSGRCYEQANEDSRAVRQYGRVLERKDSSFAAHALLALGLIAERQNRFEESVKLADRLLEKFGSSDAAIDGRLLRARVSLAQGANDDALRHFEAVVEREGIDQEKGCEAAYGAAKARMRKGDAMGAAKVLEAVVRQASTCTLLPEIGYDLGVALMKADRPDDALAAFGDMRSRYPDHALAADALHAMIGLNHSRGRSGECAVMTRDFLSRYPDHRLASSVMFVQAENEFLEGMFDSAATSYQTFLTRYPTDERAGDARSRLGSTLYRLGRFAEAEPLLREVDESPVADAPEASLLALADVYFQRGEWKLAENAFARYLKGHPDGPNADEALFRLGLAQARQGRHLEAIASFDQLLSRFPAGSSSAHAMFEKGQSLLAVENHVEAERNFRQLAEDPKADRFRAPSLRHLAALALAKRAFGEAAELYERLSNAVESADEKGEALYGKGTALISAREFSAAQAVFAALSRDDVRAEFRAAILAQLGVTLARQDRCNDAMEAFATIEGGWAAIGDRKLRAAAQYDHAWCLRELGRVDDAAAGFHRLAEAGDDHGLKAYALLNLANLEASRREPGIAVDSLRKILDAETTAPGSTPREILEDAAYRIGVYEFERERFAEAAAAFGSFAGQFHLSPLAASAMFFAGEAEFRCGKWELSVSRLSRFVELHPSAEHVDAAFLRIGEASAALQRWEQSERAYAGYLERFPVGDRWFLAQYGIGWARENQRQFDEAIEAYRLVSVRHQGVTAARAQFQIGECLFAQRKFDEAVRELLKVDILYTYPEWKAAALFEAGRCFEELSKPLEASGHFRAVAERHQGTRWADMAEKRLAVLSAAAPVR